VAKKFWSGSYNFSRNATRSLENVIIGSSEKLSESYFWIWQRIYTMSEPMSSENKKLQPQFEFDMSIFDYLSEGDSDGDDDRF
jgi:hypothetical protein